MRQIKRVVAFALAMVLTFAMTVTVFAAKNNKYTFTIKNNEDGHTYEAYQIIAGDLATDGQTLSNVKWGSGVNANIANDLGTAEDYAEKLSKYSDNSTDAIEAAKMLATKLTKAAGSTSKLESDGTYKISGLDAGYYLIKDQNKSLDGTNKSYTAYILSIVTDKPINVKADTVTSQKKVKDANDTTGVVTDWQDSADYDIGDEVPFQFKGTIPANYGSYSEYFYAFHDTQCDGLTLKKETIKVYVDGQEITAGFAVNVNGNNFDVVFDNLKTVSQVTAGSVITVEYKSVLNANAVLGSAGNPNVVKLEFSNNPNGEGHGSTPEDKVIVFTYKTVINKVDQKGDKLTGAEFTLSKKLADGSLAEIQVVKTEEGAQFSFTGLDDGDYVLKETKTPDGYNSIDDIEFTVTADHEIESDDPQLKELNGNVTTGAIVLAVDKTAGTLTTDVVNKKGSVLPSTGGAGRVALYVIGAILVLGAGVVLVTKKRVNA